MAYQVKTEPMPEHSNKAAGDPTTRYRVLVLHLPGSIIDWANAKVRATNLTFEEASKLEDELSEIYNRS